jgi:DNA replication ATP-dependent helicase Dna2
MENNITADELFGRVADVLDASPDLAGRLMHETLVLLCSEGLRDTRHAFGNLSSQVESLCRRYRVKPADIVAIQRMRRDSNAAHPLLAEDVVYDCRALSLFISAVFQTDVPAALVGRLPVMNRPREAARHIDYRYIRCTVQSWDDKTLQVTADQNGAEEPLTVDYTDTPDYIDLGYLRDLLHEGMQLNLLDCETRGSGVVVPRLVVVEPDYLLDISALAACFEDYGHHPLLYTLRRMSARPNNKYTILGNFAGSALDDIINNASYQMADTLRANFREKALEYATCTDLNTEELKRDALLQVRNLQQIVGEIFSTYDRSKAILEPSFVCERLGIQGRVDLMTTDLQLLVEQKSGKNYNIERHCCNRHGSLHVEKHYVQVLLYFGVLAYNFQLSARKANIRLLYSKYPLPDGLLEVEPLQKLFREAIRFRNEVVALEFRMAQEGFAAQLDRLVPSTLNTEHLQGFFYDHYLEPELDRLCAPLHTLSPLERAYFTRMMTFVLKEQVVSKVGAQEGVGNSSADLWNMPLSEKRETGNIYTGLHIVKREKSTSYNGFDTITLTVPDQGEDFLPNFRRGDMVYLYTYGSGEEPDARVHILYKGSMALIRTDQLVVHLNDGQQNEALFGGAEDLWCVEHGSSDMGGSSAINSLYELMTAPADCKALLLAQRAPHRNPDVQLSRSYHPAYDEVLLKAKQSSDYFLLVGPPGTGKTSMALRYLVEEELASSPVSLNDSPSESVSDEGKGGEVLLLAYTNRAVDEICEMLCQAGIDFLRMGNEYSCDPRYKRYLIANVVEENPRLEAIRQRIAGTRVIVSTTASLMARPFLFTLKHFTLAVVDEASQILEPQLVGLLSLLHKDTSAGSRQSRFVLIGDYKQLPAVVQQTQADSQVDDPQLRAIGLTDCRNSLFERLIRLEQAQGRTDFMGILHLQGRMHPDIAEFPNRMFYARERLECVPLKHQLETQLDYHEPSEDALDELLKQHRMIFMASPSAPAPNAEAEPDTDGEKCRESQNSLSDKVNLAEACMVADLLRRIHRFMGPCFDSHKSVGVIVPYRNQIAMIRREIEKLHLPELEQVSIDTVERYQGSQRDVIIYSFTIRHRYQLDFLAANCFEEDGHLIDRKLNVAITRARKQMIALGHEPTLRRNSLFDQFIGYIEQKGGYMA